MLVDEAISIPNGRKVVMDANFMVRSTLIIGKLYGNF